MKHSRIIHLLFALGIVVPSGSMAQGNRNVELIVQKGHSASINSIAFSPDGKLLASGSSDKSVALWDLKTGRQVRSLSGRNGSVSSVVFSPDGKMLATGMCKSDPCSEGEIKLWEVE